MGAAENRALVRRYKLEILNRRQLKSLGEVASERYLDHVPFPGQSPGLRGFSDRVGLLVRAFDPQWSILDLVADGEKAAVRWTLSGVHRESFLSFAASGRATRLTGIDIYRVEHGRFAEHWNVVDLSPLVRPPLTGG